MKHGTGMEPCTKIYFLFTFNPVNIRIRKNLAILTLQFDDVTVKTIYSRPISRTPDNSNFFQFPLKVRVIGSLLYM